MVVLTPAGVNIANVQGIQLLSVRKECTKSHKVVTIKTIATIVGVQIQTTTVIMLGGVSGVMKPLILPNIVTTISIEIFS